MNKNACNEVLRSPQTISYFEEHAFITFRPLNWGDVEHACRECPELLSFLREVEHARPADRVPLLFTAANRLGQHAIDRGVSFDRAFGILEYLARANGAIQPATTESPGCFDDPLFDRLTQVCGRAFRDHAGRMNANIIRAESISLRSSLESTSCADFKAVREACERIAERLVINRVADAFAEVNALDTNTYDPDQEASHFLPRTIVASLMEVFSRFWTTPENKALRTECLLIARRTIDRREKRRADLELAEDVATRSQQTAAANIVSATIKAPPIMLPEALAKAVATEAPIAEVVSFPKSEPRTVDKPEEVFARKLDALTRPPGLVGDLVDWIEGSSRRPSRILALATALAFVGTLAGRMYESPTELRTNVYLVSLAPTGYGKDHARKSIKKLAAKTNLTRFIGGERIMSASGMRTDVEQQPSILYILDEFGGFMKGLNDPRAGSHIKEIRDLILSLVGSAEDYYSGVSYRGGRSSVIQNPNMSIAGISTPTDFWNAMTGAGISDGFLPRFVIMPALGPRPNDRAPLLSSQPTDALVGAVRRLVSIKPLGGPLAGATLDASTTLTPRKLQWAGNAKDVYAGMVSRCEREANTGSEAESDLWTRLPANAQKLAMIVAIGRDPEQPEIWPQDLEWAFELVSLCVRHTIEQVDGRLAENDRQREYLFVRAAIFEAGGEGLPKAVLTKKVNGRFDSKRIGMILAQLEEAGEIYTAMIQNPNGGPIQNRFFRREAATLAAA